MEKISLSILVVNCKDYKPQNNWYLCKSGGYFTSAVRSPYDRGYDCNHLKRCIFSNDFVLMPECPGMTDQEAIEIVTAWCEQNNIAYIDDTASIEAAYHWYYKYDDSGPFNPQSYTCHLTGSLNNKAI